MHIKRSRWRSTRFAVLVAAAILNLARPAAAHEPSIPWQQPTGWPDRIIANFDGDPSRGFAVNWRTDATVESTQAQIVKATADARFDLLATTVEAATEAVHLDPLAHPAGSPIRTFNQNLASVNYHSASFGELQPDTIYAWRVRGQAACWSEWFQTRTLPTAGPISFVYFGDAQNGIRSHWSRVIRAAHAVAGDAAFFVHAGDLVDKADRDRDWAEWFTAGGHLHAQIPSVPVVGNHEYMPIRNLESGKKKRVLTPLWRAQFSLPIVEALPADLHEATYALRCTQDLHLFVLNSAPSDFRAQADWLDQQLETTDAKWRIVTMHHPYFIPMHSNQLRDNADRISAFTGVVDKHEVDLVIVGHIHTYARSTSPRELPDEPARHLAGNPQDVKTVFVISSSGARVGQLRDAAWVDEHVGDGRVEEGLPNLSIDRTAGNTPMFQVIQIDGHELEFKAYTAVGDVYDRFTLVKNGRKKMLTNGTEVYGEPRLFENTGPYEEFEVEE